nr:hypothetical protein [Abalone asfa-like virus]
MGFTGSLFPGVTGVWTAGDWVDKLHATFTTAALAILMVFSTTSEFFIKEKIDCYLVDIKNPATSSYLNNYCWLSNTYAVKEHGQMPKSIAARHENEIKYYQWVPFILLLMAIGFRIPILLWNLLVNTTINLKGLSQELEKTQGMTQERIKTITNQIARWVTRRRLFHTSICYKYLIYKLLLIINVCGQLYILEHIFHISEMKGFGFTTNINLPQLPYKTYCDVYIRNQANVNTHTAECLLPLNQIFSKMFPIIAAWYILLLGISLLNFLQWLVKLVLFPLYRMRFFGDRLSADSLVKAKKGGKYTVPFRKFVYRYLGKDGFLALHLLIQSDHGGFHIDRVIQNLWELFNQEESLETLLPPNTNNLWLSSKSKENLEMLPLPPDSGDSILNVNEGI